MCGFSPSAVSVAGSDDLQRPDQAEPRDAGGGGAGGQEATQGQSRWR